MSEIKKGLIVESPEMAKQIARALASLAEWATLPDHTKLPPTLGQEMVARGYDMAIIHANKPSDKEPILSVVDENKPVLVIARNERHGAVAQLREMYHFFAELGIPIMTLPLDVVALQKKVNKLLYPEELS